MLNNPLPDLRDLTPMQLQDLVTSLGEKPYRARQLLLWLYQKDAETLADMTDISRSLKQKLAREAQLKHMLPARSEQSPDGACKLLYILDDGLKIESVLIPEDDHQTLCVSSQAGCRQGCLFCHTGQMGFKRNLTPSEILGQILAARRLCSPDKPLTNLVFMGMGEPLDNMPAVLIALEHILGDAGLAFSQRKVTVSTAGLAAQLPVLAKHSPASLAVSLNAADDALRDSLMPVNRRFPLSVLKAALAAYPLKPTRRITLEYVLLAGVNDQPRHALALAQWAKGLKAKINLIPFNAHEGSGFAEPSEDAVLAFQEVLIQQKYTALLRRSRGAGIRAACGQLAGESAGAIERKQGQGKDKTPEKALS